MAVTTGYPGAVAVGGSAPDGRLVELVEDRGRPGGDAVPAGAGDVPPLARCDVEPEMFRVFSFAVLALHRRMPMRRCGVDMCTCGQPSVLCEYTALADQLLYSPAADAVCSDAG